MKDQGANTDTTATRLVDVARKLFAEKGFDAVSVREITSAANANLGAITYHFGSKQGLYDAVLEVVFEPVTGWLADGSGKGSRSPITTGLDRVEHIMRKLFGHLAANPDMQLLILRQAVQRDSLPGPARQTVGLILGAVADAVRAGQADGSVRAGNPALLAVSVVSQPVYFGLLGRLAPERLSGGRPIGEEVVEHAVRFVRAALRSGAEEEK